MAEGVRSAEVNELTFCILVSETDVRIYTVMVNPRGASVHMPTFTQYVHSPLYTSVVEVNMRLLCR